MAVTTTVTASLPDMGIPRTSANFRELRGIIPRNHGGLIVAGPDLPVLTGASTVAQDMYVSSDHTHGRPRRPLYPPVPHPTGISFRLCKLQPMAHPFSSFHKYFSP